MLRSALALSVALFPAVAFADPGQVPNVNPIAQAGLTQGAPGAAVNNGQESVKIPPGMPPPVQHKLSPDPVINGKEKVANQMSKAWRDHFDRPQRGEDGTIRWVFGSSLPTVTCAPLQVCDIALEPGEVINTIHVGDKVRWSVLPAVSGSGPDRTTHIVVKPYDSGLVSDVHVYTTRRQYSIKLLSTQHQWTAQTAFIYPQDAQTAWAAYGAAMASATPAKAGLATFSNGDGGVQFYEIDGNASWRPLRVYATGGKTIIEFSGGIQYGSAPALVGLGSGGGWFSSPAEQMLTYRVTGNSFVVDGVIDHAMLVLGVGSSQQRVDIKRTK